MNALNLGYKQIKVGVIQGEKRREVEKTMEERIGKIMVAGRQECKGKIRGKIRWIAISHKGGKGRKLRGEKVGNWRI